MFFAFLLFTGYWAPENIYDRAKFHCGRGNQRLWDTFPREGAHTSLHGVKGIDSEGHCGIQSATRNLANCGEGEPLLNSHPGEVRWGVTLRIGGTGIFKIYGMQLVNSSTTASKLQAVPVRKIERAMLLRDTWKSVIKTTWRVMATTFWAKKMAIFQGNQSRASPT